MTRTHEKVRYAPKSKAKHLTPNSAADGVERAFKMLEGRWKLLILFHLFGGKMLRFSDLERAIPAISQKMLIQQLRQMEKDGIVGPPDGTRPRELLKGRDWMREFDDSQHG